MRDLNTAIVMDKQTGQSSRVELDAVDSPRNSVFKITLDLSELETVEGRAGDLVIVLKDGSEVQIAGFFQAPPEERNELIIEDDEGVLWWGQYDTPLSDFSFTEITLSEPVVAEEGVNWWLLGAAAGAVALLAGAGSSSGGSSGGSSSGVDGGDTTAPDAPTAEFDPAGEEISGQAEPGSVVTVYDDTGEVIGQTTADDTTGEYIVTVEPPQIDGETVQVTATDDAGNESVPTDVVAPDFTTSEPTDLELPIFVVIDDVGTITGPLSNGSVTDDNQPTFNGSGATPGNLISIYDGTPDAGNLIGTATVQPDGTWSLTPDGELGDGVHTLSVTVTDSEGDESDPASFELTVDTIAPDAPVINPTDGSTINGTAEPGSTVAVDTDGDGEPDYTTTTSPDGSWAVTPDTPLEGGTEITATATDEAGNTSDPGEQVVDDGVSDTLPPAAPVIVSAIDNVAAETGTLSSGDHTNDATPTLNGTAEAGSRVSVSLNGDLVGTTVAGSNGQWSLTVVPALADGSNYSFTATAEDDAGNTSGVSAPFELTVDTTAPPAPTPSLAADTGVAGDGITSDGTVNVGGLETNASWEYSTDAGSSWNQGSGSSFELAEGDYEAGDVLVRQTDLAGNVSPDGSLGAVTVDTSAPGAGSNSIAFNDGGDELLSAAEATSVTLSGQIESDASLDSLTITDGTTTLTVDAADISVDGDGVVSVAGQDLSGLNDGTLTVTLAVTDAAGNSGTVIDTTVLDTTGPSTGDGSNSIAFNDGGDELLNAAEATSVTLSGQIEGDASLDSLTISDGTTTLTVDAADISVDGDGVVSVAGQDLSGLDDGTLTVTLAVTDAAGNSGTVIDTTVLDTTGPSTGDGSNSIAFNDGGDELLNAAEATSVTLSGQIESDASLDSLTITDGTTTLTVDAADISVDGDGVVSVAGQDLSGLNDGTLTVTLAVTDAAGNSGTVIDTTVLDATAPDAPVISPTDGTLLVGTSEPGSLVAIDVDGNGTPDYTTTADSGGNWSVVPSPALDNGTEVTATATDAAGNTSGPGSAVVDTTIPDTTPPATPIIALAVDNVDPQQGDLSSGDSTNDTTPTLTGTAEAGSTVTVYQDTVNIGTTTADALGNWSFAVPVLADATYSFTVTATDAASNVSGESAAFELTIDTLAPAAPLLSLNADTGTIGDGITSDGTVNVGGIEPGATWEYSTDGGATWLEGTGSSFELPEGEYADGDVLARQSDLAGNVSPDGSLGAVTVDATPPGTGDGSNSIAFNDGGDELLNAMEASSVTLSGQIESDASIDSLTITDGTTTLTVAVGDISVGATGVISVLGQDLSSLNDGTLTVTLAVTDAAGNSGTVTDTTVLDTVIDTNDNGNTVTFTSITEDTGGAGDFVTSDTSLEFSGSVDTDDGNSLSVTVGTDTYVLGVDPQLSVTDGTWVLDLTGTDLAAGTYPVVVTVADVAGNTDSVTQDVVIETSGPVVSSVAGSVSEEGLPGGSADAQGTPDDTTNATTVNGTLSISSESAITEVGISGPSGVTAGGNPVNWSGSFSGDTYTLTGTAAGSGVVATLTLTTAGAYSFVLMQSLDHPGQLVEDILALDFAVTATDSAGNISVPASLVVNVEDDMPVAASPTVFSITSTPTTVSGSLVDSFGADEGYVSSLTVDGYTFNFDGTNITTSGASDTVLTYTADDFSNGVLTISTVKGETIEVTMADGSYSYTHSGVSLLPAVPQEAPVVTLGDSSSLLGLVSAEALGLVNLSASQQFAASDANNDITSVIIEYNAITVSLGGGFNVAGAQLLADELGISYTVDDLGLMDFAASISVTASDGGTLDNLRLNEFLGAIYADDGVLTLGIGSSLSISATDNQGNTDTEVQSDLLDLGLLDTNVPGYMVLGDEAANTLTGTADADRLYGFAGDDTLDGSAGSDILRGGDGADVLDGGDGNDILIGGAGADTLTGGSGLDLFRWENGDQATAGAPVVDTITDFNFVPASADGDVLDFADLLQGEGRIGANPGNLANYLHFELSGNDTVISISSTGQFLGGYDSAQTDQQIVLSNVDLIGDLTSDQDVIAYLLEHGNLLVDEATADTDLLGGTTSMDAVITDNDGDTAGTSVQFDSTGATPPAPLANYAPVVQVDTSALLGIAGAEAAGLTGLNNQDLTAADPDGNLRTVVVAYQPVLSVNLDAQTLTASSQLAEALGLQFTIENDAGLLGLVAPSSVLTITAIGGGDIDNLAVNELLATVQFDNGQSLLGLNLEVEVQAALLDATTITATDSEGLSASASLGALTNVNALNTLLGSDTLIEGDSGNNTLTGGADSERIYGYGGSDILNGNGGDDWMRGGSGNDTLNGGDGNDVLIDGAGVDTFNGGAGNDLIWTTSDTFASIDGGDDFDTLLLDGGIDLEPGALGLGTISNIERIDLGTDDGSSTLTLSEQAVLDLTDANDQLQIAGDSSDTVTAIGATLVGSTQIDGVNYDQYTLGTATLLVEDDINTVVA